MSFPHTSTHTHNCLALGCTEGAEGVEFELGPGLNPASNDACVRAQHHDCCGRICARTSGCEAYAWRLRDHSCVTLATRPKEVKEGWVLCPKPTEGG